MKERETLNASLEGALLNFRTTTDEILAAVNQNASQMRDTAQTLTGVARTATSESTAASVASEDTSSKVQTVAAAASAPRGRARAFVTSRERFLDIGVRNPRSSRRTSFSLARHVHPW